MNQLEANVLIVGGGMAGASLAWFLAPHASIIIAEAEAQPGYHSTGRSAAFFLETYGGPGVQPLSSASRPFLFDPPKGFSQRPLVGDRGALHVASLQNKRLLDALEAEFAGCGVEIERLIPEAAARRAPMLRPEWLEGAILEPGCKDIDVAALHQAFLAGARARGVRVVSNAPITSLARAGTKWTAGARELTISVDIVVNAAGAWADAVAELAGAVPLGIQPLRRTMVVGDLGAPPPPDLPVVIDAAGALYFKPDAGLMWISPHDETPCPAGDVQPEELDIAIGIDRFEKATTSTVKRVARAWAGLRSFSPDRLPVYGFDPRAGGFFWCAGQGGFGIQTAPAAGQLAASLIDARVPAPAGADPLRYSPRRFKS